MKKIIYALTISLAMWQVPAYAVYFEDGNDMWKNCADSDGKSNFYSGMCLGYIAGAVDSITSNIKDCLPAGTQLGQIRDLVANHLRDNPQDRHLPASWIVNRSLYVAYCPAGTPL